MYKCLRSYLLFVCLCRLVLLFLLKYNVIFKKPFKNNIIQNYALKIKALQTHTLPYSSLHLKPYDLNLGDRDSSIPSFPFKFYVLIFSSQMKTVSSRHGIIICPRNSLHSLNYLREITYSFHLSLLTTFVPLSQD